MHLEQGRPEPASAAWNPVAGFTDATGRLIWSAIGDPAMIPFPDNASWMPNRVQAEVMRVVGQSGGLLVPADAVEKVLNEAERLTAIEVKIRAELAAGATLEQVLAKYGHV